MAYFLPEVTRFGLVCVGMAQAIEPLMSPLHGAMASSKPLCSDFSLSLSGLAGCMIGFEGAQGQQGQRGSTSLGDESTEQIGGRRRKRGPRVGMTLPADSGKQL